MNDNRLFDIDLKIKELELQIDELRRERNQIAKEQYERRQQEYLTFIEQMKVEYAALPIVHQDNIKRIATTNDWKLHKVRDLRNYVDQYPDLCLGGLRKAVVLVDWLGGGV